MAPLPSISSTSSIWTYLDASAPKMALFPRDSSSCYTYSNGNLEPCNSYQFPAAGGVGIGIGVCVLIMLLCACARTANNSSATTANTPLPKIRAAPPPPPLSQAEGGEVLDPPPVYSAPLPGYETVPLTRLEPAHVHTSAGRHGANLGGHGAAAAAGMTGTMNATAVMNI